jgi:hypothetical protein
VSSDDRRRYLTPVAQLTHISHRQVFLERTFPAYPRAPHPKKSDDPAPAPKLSIRNTVVKLALDQSVSAVANTLMFSVFNRAIQSAMRDAPVVTGFFSAVSYWVQPGALALHDVDYAEVWAQSLGEMWPLLLASWRFWPVVAVVNYSMVQSVRVRNLIGGLAGIAWGTYMSLVAAGR